MNKIWLITQREFTTRVKKRSFIIMSILGPILFAGFLSSIILFSIPRDTEIQKIAVIDSTKGFIFEIPNSKHLIFSYLKSTDLDSLKKNLDKTEYAGILYITPDVVSKIGGVQYFSYKNPSMSTLNYISNKIDKVIQNEKLKAYNIQHIDEILKKTETNISIVTVKLQKGQKEKETNTDLARWVGYASALIIYMFILLYGVQVMRGVIEEKSNRIVEVILSSVKPFQLMMGKVLGVAMAAICQFIIWIVLSGLFLTIARGILVPDINPANIAPPPQSIMENTHMVTQMQQSSPQTNQDIVKLFNNFDSINFYIIIGSFLFYFIAGYLLYSSLFAAVGAAVDNDTDSQQFVMPITMPLILGVVVMIKAFMDPDSSIAYWFSIIPLTSPIVMMARIPFGVPYEQVAISMVLLILTFIATIWMAAKIYRVGILMYGKKVSFGEMLKWLRYKA